MKVIKKYDVGVYAFYCPGCDCKHIYTTKESPRAQLHWVFNGNMEVPTFTPSLLNRWGKNADPNWQEPEGEAPENGWSGTCHLFVTNGQIVYCSDSTHKYAGQTIDMVDLDKL